MRIEIFEKAIASATVPCKGAKVSMAFFDHLLANGRIEMRKVRDLGVETEAHPYFGSVCIHRDAQLDLDDKDFVMPPVAE